MTLVTLTAPSSPSVHWRRADSDVIVATDDGEYAGFVAVVSNGYDAHGALGEDLGRHASAYLAKTTVESAREKNPAAPQRRSRSFRLIRPLRTRRSGTHGR